MTRCDAGSRTQKTEVPSALLQTHRLFANEAPKYCMQAIEIHCGCATTGALHSLGRTRVTSDRHVVLCVGRFSGTTFHLSIADSNLNGQDDAHAKRRRLVFHYGKVLGGATLDPWLRCRANSSMQPCFVCAEARRLKGVPFPQRAHGWLAFPPATAFDLFRCSS